MSYNQKNNRMAETEVNPLISEKAGQVCELMTSSQHVNCTAIQSSLSADTFSNAEAFRLMPVSAKKPPDIE